ncbi:MAG: DUF1573 domain-containing protein [Bacteroidales bacterium]|nr:DUF1573 domain-containing protein [Bacteroidales bacterium]MBR4687762.1 DUF1573 domain-containing protein [Bacteroidales bacterium]
MKRQVFLLTLLLMAAACGSRDGIRTIRTAEGQDADLGTIREIDGPVTVRLLIRNDFPDTLYPVQLHTPCGCTNARFDQKPVAPGADEVLEVTYNPAYRPGPMREEIQVRYVNSPVRVRTFTISGKVIGFNHPIEEDRPYAFGEGLYMSHKILSYGLLRPGETGDFFFRYGNGNTRKATVTFDIPEEWQPYVRMRQPGRMKADQRDTLHVKFTMPEGIDSAAFSLQPRVDGRKTEEVLSVFVKKRDD